MKRFACTDKTVLLRCCEESNEVEWTKIPLDDEVTPLDETTSGCIYSTYVIY